MFLDGMALTHPSWKEGVIGWKHVKVRGVVNFLASNVHTVGSSRLYAYDFGDFKGHFFNLYYHKDAVIDDQMLIRNALYVTDSGCLWISDLNIYTYSFCPPPSMIPSATEYTYLASNGITNYCYWTLDKDCFYDEAETIYDLDSITPDMWVHDITETVGFDRI